MKNKLIVINDLGAMTFFCERGPSINVQKIDDSCGGSTEFAIRVM